MAIYKSYDKEIPEMMEEIEKISIGQSNNLFDHALAELLGKRIQTSKAFNREWKLNRAAMFYKIILKMIEEDE